MRYVSSIERLARQDAILENSRENAIDILSTRFGEVPNSIVEALNRIDDASVLKTLIKRTATVNSVAEFQQVIDEVTLQGGTESA